MTGCTDAVLAAVRREIEMRRRLIDSATDLGNITIRVRMHAGTTTIRGIVWEEERVYKRAGLITKDASDTVRP